MVKNNYLSIGTKLGGHYEIEKVLSEDDFEILYLAKDLHKRGEYVVLKELFFKSYSHRDGNEVKTLAKSKIIFEETKKEVLKEVEETLENPLTDKIATFGTFEENNTVYTIMEFRNDSSLEGYLGTDSIEENTTNYTQKEPIIEKEIEKKKKRPKSSIFLKILITSLLICVGLGFYAYNMIKTDKEKIKSRPPKAIAVKEIPETEPKNSLPTTKKELLNDYVENPDITDENSDSIDKKEETKKSLEGAEYITDVEAYKREQERKRAKEEEEQRLEQERKLAQEREEIAQEDEEERLREEEYKRMQEEVLNSKAVEEEQNAKESIDEIETTNHPENDVPPFEDAEENLPLGAVAPNSLGTRINARNNNENLLGTKIGEKKSKEEETPTTNKQAIKQFLNNFIRISGNGSIDEILSNYDNDVERYFSLRNVNHNTIRKDKINYHKKWTHRKFNLVNFEVTKVYKKNNETYYDIKTTTNWSVSNDAGKSIAGSSNGVMTLRETDSGFKVTSIYTSKSK